MTFWQTLIITAIPTGAAVITAIVGIRDLGVRRRLETSKQFLTLFALAHGRPIDGRDGVGVGEQVATVQLIADFARREKLLRGAASGGLSYLAGWDEDEPAIDSLIPPLLASLPEADAVEAAGQALVLLRNNAAGRHAVATAARKALETLRVPAPR